MMLFAPGPPPTAGHTCNGALERDFWTVSRFSHQYVIFASEVVSSGARPK